MTTANAATPASTAGDVRNGTDAGKSPGSLAATPAMPAASMAATEQQLFAALASLPGVRSVATAYDHPLEANWSESPLVVGNDVSPDERRQVELRIVSPGYFEALDVQVLEGRGFTELDGLNRPGVAAVNEAFAREIGGRVLGRRIRSGTPRFTYGDTAPAEFEVVAVVENERSHGLERPVQPAFYLTTRQFPQPEISILVRTSGDPMALAGALRSAVRAFDPRITLGRATTLDAILREQLAGRDLTTDVLGGFGLAALALASLAIGITLGTGLAVVAGRMIETLLVGVSASDPRTLAAVATTLLGIAILAATIPARRAARVDPVEALRAE